ncbi:helix-turn-helix domain-containing protein [Actinomadura rugatobispora]|uniref:Scr1 family TA system antitoxin-like transcriptional regulator n=1 Tax=Actinomadura rugatobispora TaxID=1994 RepID=A0ABW1ADJ6_9ACTN|nr:helix-turn-helix transcriptional regulator [Actinomadura rugatobispora]
MPSRVTLSYKPISSRHQAPVARVKERSVAVIIPGGPPMPRHGRQLHPHSLLTYFGAELRRLREAADLSMAQLGEAIGYTPQWIGAVELGNEKPSPEFAEDLDTYFKTEGMFVRLVEAHERELKRPKVPPNFPRFAELEQKASSMHIFEALLITGLLQTEDYARAVFLTVQQPEDVEPLLAARMERQSILERQKPPRLLVTVDEHALRTVLGDIEVMRNQLEHMIKVAHRPNVMLQVVPEKTGGYAGSCGSFTILGFGNRPNAAYIEAAGVGQVIEESSNVANFHIGYDLIRGQALPVEQSLLLIKSIMESL